MFSYFPPCIFIELLGHGCRRGDHARSTCLPALLPGTYSPSCRITSASQFRECSRVRKKRTSTSLSKSPSQYFSLSCSFLSFLHHLHAFPPSSPTLVIGDPSFGFVLPVDFRRRFSCCHPCMTNVLRFPRASCCHSCSWWESIRSEGPMDSRLKMSRMTSGKFNMLGRMRRRDFQCRVLGRTSGDGFRPTTCRNDSISGGVPIKHIENNRLNTRSQ